MNDKIRVGLIGYGYASKLSCALNYGNARARACGGIQQR
ncbi:hypothetical protein SEEH0312_12997, partial [Salmonella enterica subsp. enterica serovar Heidelberg str. 88-0312]